MHAHLTSLSLKPDKGLGQHFLIIPEIAKRIVDNLIAKEVDAVIEVGSGTGALTRWLVLNCSHPLFLVEVDPRLHQKLAKYSTPKVTVVPENFLTWFPRAFEGKSVAIIGNFPYHISSSLFFNILTHRQQVRETVCMVQHEVAQRLAAPPGSKIYGLLSVLLQAYYDVNYLFSVQPNAFWPPPQVMSGVVRLVRNGLRQLPCDEKLFVKVVKAGFQQRRKMLRNALSGLGRSLKSVPEVLLRQRAEALSSEDFVTITRILSLD